MGRRMEGEQEEGEEIRRQSLCAMPHPAPSCILWALACSLPVFEQNTRWAERSFETAPSFIRVQGVHRAVILHLMKPDREGEASGGRVAVGEPPG